MVAFYSLFLKICIYMKVELKIFCYFVFTFLLSEICFILLGSTILQHLVFLPLLSCIGLFIFSYYLNVRELKMLSLWYSLNILYKSVCVWSNLLIIVGFPQEVCTLTLPVTLGFNLVYSLGVDGLNIWFVMLSALLIPICFLLNWEVIRHRVLESIILYFYIEFLLFNVFLSLDIFIFYLCFEALLIPMYLIIGIWGSRGRRIHASYQFFLYTLVGSVAMLLAIIYIYYTCGSTNWFVVASGEFSDSEILLLLGTFYLAFVVKVPLYPVHIWLPEAHVEAPTGGSVLLAGIMLKLGTYGILKYCIFLWPLHIGYYVPVMFVLTTVGIIYGSLATIRQIDLKKSIAYSSVAHMSFLVQGLFMEIEQGLEGAVFFMLGHGFVSSGLFICIGILYDRYHTRIISYYGSLVLVMPMFTVFFYVFSLGNLNFPGTVNFVSEFLTSVAISYKNFFVMFLGSFSMLLSGIYAIWLYNRAMFGSIKQLDSFYCDITRREYNVLLPLVLCMFVFGIYPEIILNSIRIVIVYYNLSTSY